MHFFAESVDSSDQLGGNDVPLIQRNHSFGDFCGLQRIIEEATERDEGKRVGRQDNIK